MDLSQIYQPIKEELENVEEILKASFQETRNKSILKVNRFLWETPGKKLRPALVILSARVTLKQKSKTINEQLIKVASSIELIHMASLIHDDVIDHSKIRHNRHTVNSQWGADVSIALGDYLYSLAFKLISGYNNPDILDCISTATKSMCEGELIQVCERDNLNLSKERYIIIVKKKTASLFAASCQAGAIASKSSEIFENALEGYGLDFGIAFQIIDDYLDLVGERKKLGKEPGQDIAVGELTLPILNLLESVSERRKQTVIRLLKERSEDCLKEIKTMIFNSDALLYTKKIILFYLTRAKKRLKILPDSSYRNALSDLVDFVYHKSFD